MQELEVFAICNVLKLYQCIVSAWLSNPQAKILQILWQAPPSMVDGDQLQATLIGRAQEDDRCSSYLLRACILSR